ncbi:uncharacterized protein LOC111640326 [Centruroides sculpturatus]|uniref:uncharacterized protein LOC111640326 n=1 Tax=Centruroides sculpturatus TaxID=218467 RepID=UPI000C6EF1D1|nr:uncharacterized protein LOC111640326 [Centruroides sculpturatus]
MAIPDTVSCEDEQENEGNMYCARSVPRNRASRSGLTLNFGRHLPLPILTPSPSEEETLAEGHMLFQDFVTSQVQQEGLQNQYLQISANIPSRYRSNVEPLLQADGDQADCGSSFENDLSVSTPLGYKNPVWAKAGRELRLLAEKFAKSEERKAVRARANQVDIHHITWDEFQDLLTELFLDGDIRRERIVTLFFFCTDIMIRALKEKIADKVKCLFVWSLRFISEKVCTWVQQQGGWGVVLGNYVPKAVITICALTVAVFTVFYVWKKT